MNKIKKESSQKIKQRIVRLFYDKVRGKTPDTSSANSAHDGKGGHWLETQMGIVHNRKNEPDLMGFEMKNYTAVKTTFGDWSASYYIFKDKKYNINRDDFIKIFGAPNPEKNNRYSWSGKITPKINIYSCSGQILKIDESGNIYAIYSFKKDTRPDKSKIVPKEMQKDNLVIARWDAGMMKKRVEHKFNKLGWFKCIENEKRAYTKIVFGPPIDFSTWIMGVREGLIFLDSGMYQGNPRPYSQWRAYNKYWDSLITDTY